jgi:hypothetical protein
MSIHTEQNGKKKASFNVSTKTIRFRLRFTYSSTCQSNFPSKFQKLLTEAYVVAFLSTLLLPILRKLTDDNIEGLSKTN